jgi:hypothetical protein
MSLMSLAITLLFPSMSTGPAECPNGTDVYKGTRISSIYMEKSRSCSRYLHPNKSRPQWRIHAFHSSGLYMIFSSFGNGPESQDTGARSIWFFPRRLTPDFKLLDDEISIQTASGAEVFFSSSHSNILRSPDMDIAESDEFDRQGDGGISLKSSPGIILDNGFQLGEAAYSFPRRTSEFRDAKGQSCKVVNKEVFDYKYIANPGGNPVLDEVEFRYPTWDNGDQRLKEFLQTRCPNLDLSSL